MTISELIEDLTDKLNRAIDERHKTNDPFTLNRLQQEIDDIRAKISNLKQKLIK
jgi:hypothetical protein